MIELPNLAELDNQMTEAGVLRRQFDWRNGRGHMRVSYLKDAAVTFGTYKYSDRTPFAVLVFVNARGPGSFSKLVNRRFEIDLYMDDDYGTLKEILGINGHGAGDRFDLRELFTNFNEAIPGYRQCRSPRPADIRPRGEVEEADRLYFLRIQRPNRGHTTEENLRKTRIMLGDNFAEYCRKTGQSSFWTDTPNDLTVDDISRIIGDEL